MIDRETAEALFDADLRLEHVLPLGMLTAQQDTHEWLAEPASDAVSAFKQGLKELPPLLVEWRKFVKKHGSGGEDSDYLAERFKEWARDYGHAGFLVFFRAPYLEKGNPQLGGGYTGRWFYADTLPAVVRDALGWDAARHDAWEKTWKKAS